MRSLPSVVILVTILAAGRSNEKRNPMAQSPQLQQVADRIALMGVMLKLASVSRDTAHCRSRAAGASSRIEQK